MKATKFEFVSYTYTTGSPDILFQYRMHFSDADSLDFTEKITFADSDWVGKLPEAFVKGVLDDLHLMLGISYYKTFCPPAFVTKIELSQKQADFWNTVYKKGLSEFLYRNNVSLDLVARFESSDSAVRNISELEVDENKLLVGIGGGKDSIVALELLKKYELTGFIKSDGSGDDLAEAVTDIADIPLLVAHRELDAKLLVGVEGSYNGHVPISAVYAFLGVLQAALTGNRYFVVANEHSSNFGNLIEEGNEVNHKWSGSSEFENLFQTYVRENLTPSVGYFSITRPFYELRVVKMFVERGEEYFETFSSCNRNFAHNHDMEGKKWCGECPKCAFAYLMLSAFLEEEVLLRIFKKNLFEDAQLLPLYKDLLGLGAMKPFDCVGTFDESKVALSMAAERHGKTLVVATFLNDIGDTTELQYKIFSAQRADTVPTRFRMSGMESALILGYGKEGKTSEQYLKNRYPSLQTGVADQTDGPDYLTKQEEYDIVIKTPVIPSALVTRQFTTATNFFFNEVSRSNIIGVTGSKGKSTTATLIYEMLKASGKKARLIGNIGTPALESLLEKPIEEDELYVFELSSYQLADLDVSPHIAVVTSLFPEHLDYHGSLDAYFEAKRRITDFQTEGDVFMVANGFPVLEAWSEETQASVIAQEALPFMIQNPVLRGEHMRSNAELSYTVARMFGVEEADAEKVVQSFKGLPHRLQSVGIHKGITFYDDSISTTPESTIAGIEALGDVDTVILGGVDRGYDFTLLEKKLRETGVRNIVLFPESGEHMLVSEEGFNVLHTSSMEEAVEFAFAETAEGKSCLLSPAAPSYNLFKNFEERGEVFQAVVTSSASRNFVK